MAIKTFAGLITSKKFILTLVSIWYAIFQAALCSNSNDGIFLRHPNAVLSEPLVPASDHLLRSKRSEIDLQTCIDNFNVHRDKIIRTQDSQNMGAKYLNEIDLGSREECLRLCCETEDCDVFVFEEKNSGSCYLFHCGPPEDFKCKFTHHVNYSSAVLSINRHLPDLESQIKLTKHIQDTSKLRKPDMEPQDDVRLLPVIPQTAKVPSSSTTLTSVITKEVVPIEKQTEARKCSRYQFECRSTGECIAIYNACDGIPQCADGSDEAHELGCPAPEAVASTAAQTTPPPTPKKMIAVPIHQVPAAAQYGREGEVLQQQKLPLSNNYQSVYHPHPQMPQVQLQQESDFLRPVPDPRLPGRTQYEPVVPMQNYLGIPNSWGIPRQSPGLQPVQQIPQYQENTNHVFASKENSPHNDGQISQIQYPEYAGRMPNYYGENYRQPIQQENWPTDEIRYPQQPQTFQQENVAPPIVPAKTEGTSHLTENVQQAAPVPKPAEIAVNSKHVQEKLAHDLKHSKENMEHGPNQKITVLSKVDKLTHQEQYPDVITYKMTDDTQDGFSHIPRGAILSLTLGLIITGVMAILIGCRLRVVKRRLRKGGKGYAHDADYLVNGMYL